MDTTRNQLGLALLTFIRNPDQWRLLGRRPDLGWAAAEEALRVNPTTTWVTREAVRDFEFQGVPIAAGTTLHLLTEAAATDPRAVGDLELDITAKRPPHFAFGSGTHHCIGHFVARTDISIALPLLARRMRDPRIDGDVRPLPMSGNTGLDELPVAFTDGSGHRGGSTRTGAARDDEERAQPAPSSAAGRRLRRGRQRGTDATLREMNAGQLDFPDDSFDVVIFSYVLSVVGDPSRAMAEAARVLAPHGCIWIVGTFSETAQEPVRRAISHVLTAVGGASLIRSLSATIAGTPLHVTHHEVGGPLADVIRLDPA